MLARNQDQTKKWHQLSEDDREATELYVTGNGSTIEAAFAAACKAAEESCLLP
jgi:fructoselysine-6-P-deglycase FrlB-like protein